MEEENQSYDIYMFSKQYPIIRDFIYQYISYKELHSQGKGPRGGEKFWAYTVNSHLSQAIISWTMVFGSMGNKTHWKKLDSKETTWNSFINDLIKALKITELEWVDYWNVVMDFRNKFIAHREVYFNKPVPYLDIAYKTVHFYDDWIREFVYPDIFEGPTLKEMEDEYRLEMKKTIELLYTEEEQS